VVHIASQMPELEVTWIDTSPERFPRTPPETVTLVPAENPAPLMAHAPRHAQHLIFTYAHSLDLSLCHAALLRGFDFCGLIGSASKWARFQRRLLALGHAPTQISKITCPIGDPNLGKQPISIAIGVTQALLLHNMNAKTRHRSALS
ncbi:MAG: XdhC family protein, partial [Planktomarina temperata]|nr:XdhC family protein [Planktomarina temperata]